MGTSATKIALGVGCGVFAALAAAFIIFAGSCVAIGGSAITGVAESMAERESEKVAALNQLEIHSMDSERKGGANGWLELTGSIRNDGPAAVGLFKIECELRDDGGNVLDTEVDHMLEDLQPGASARWEISFFDAPPGADQYACIQRP